MDRVWWVQRYGLKDAKQHRTDSQPFGRWEAAANPEVLVECGRYMLQADARGYELVWNRYPRSADVCKQCK